MNTTAGVVEDRTWKLRQLGGLAVDVADARRPYLTLEPLEKQLTGSSGCNQIAGSYELNGSHLEFGPLIMTKRACLEGMELERDFASVLHRTAAWKIADASLRLLDQDGTLLAVFSE